jgi:hypothetical protein
MFNQLHEAAAGSCKVYSMLWQRSWYAQSTAGTTGAQHSTVRVYSSTLPEPGSSLARSTPHGIL